MLSINKSIVHSLDPCRFAKQALDFNPDPWQSEVLRYGGDRLMMLCSRQSGKSAVASVKAVHTALFYPNSLTLIVSPSQRQSSEMHRNILKLLEVLPDGPAKTEDNKLSTTLQNGSRIVSLPSNPDTLRGYAGPDLVIVDEASRTTDGLYYSIRPFFATGGGQLIALSTPNGRQGWYFDAWEKETNWKKVKVVAEDCPRISASFLKDELESLGKFIFSQEYQCAFIEAENAVFRYTDIMRCFKPEVKAINLWEDDE